MPEGEVWRMKKIITILLMTAVLITMTGCNKQWIDTTYHFDRAILSLPDGTVIEGEVESWTDFNDGDQIQVKIDGVTYLVHSSDVVLIAE